MRLLLDTHVLIWWWTEKASLSDIVRTRISTQANPVFVSAASAWEIATKHRLGRVPELDERFDDLERQFRSELAQDRFELLDVSAAHGLRAGAYEVEHRDPFDRLLAAQAELEFMVLLTRDPALGAFPCETLW